MTDRIDTVGLLSIAPDIKGRLLLKMLDLKLEKAYRQDMNEVLQKDLVSFAAALEGVAEDIREKLESFA
jgi:hypothetical protein